MNIKLVFDFYFDNINCILKKKVEDLYAVNKYIQEYHGFKFTDFSLFYCIKENDSDKSKFYKNTEKNIIKINDICNHYCISIFNSEIFKNEKAYNDSKYTIQYSYGKYNTPGDYNMIIDSEIYEKLNIKEYFMNIYKLLLERKFKINYAFYHFFENSKQPSFILSGAIPENLNEDEERFAKAWGHNQEFYKSYIRGVCWGNIILLDLFSDEVIDKIISIVGETNCHKIDNRFIFFLPFTTIDEIQQNIRKYSSIRKMIENILIQYNLLMPIEYIKR